MQRRRSAQAQIGFYPKDLHARIQVASFFPEQAEVRTLNPKICAQTCNYGTLEAWTSVFKTFVS